MAERNDRPGQQRHDADAIPERGAKLVSDGPELVYHRPGSSVPKPFPTASPDVLQHRIQHSLRKKEAEQQGHQPSQKVRKDPRVGLDPDRDRDRGQTPQAREAKPAVVHEAHASQKLLSC